MLIKYQQFSKRLYFQKVIFSKIYISSPPSKKGTSPAIKKEAEQTKLTYVKQKYFNAKSKI